MNDPVILTIAVVLLLLVGVAVAVAVTRRRRRQLAERFGPEYEHTVSTHGRRGAERELEARREHVDHLRLRDLSEEERSELVRRWDRVQTRFVDQPAAAVADADSLIGETMRLRGYPVDEVADDERREADLSAAHPHEVGLYREASAIARRSGRDEASTEELRQAMVHYRTLFESLAGAGHAEAAEPSAPAGRPSGDDGRLERSAIRPPAERPGEPVAAGEAPQKPPRRSG
ncbi:MAG TPA: hypothetical protein VM617_05905 [Thermoanaerobaculia bacterium]|nr:hypothetical protein [Thermoanaerobaculia bacterium]